MKGKTTGNQEDKISAGILQLSPNVASIELYRHITHWAMRGIKVGERFWWNCLHGSCWTGLNWMDMSYRNISEPISWKWVKGLRHTMS